MKTVSGTAIGLAAIGASLFAAQASGQPVRRPGLWDTQITAMGTQMHTQMCVGAEKPGDASLFSAGGRGPGRDGCGAGPQITSMPGGMHYHIVCRPSPQMTLDSTGTVTGDFRTNYTIHAVTTMTPPLHGTGAMETSVTAHYMGQCPAGMNPGDRSINGRITTR